MTNRLLWLFVMAALIQAVILFVALPALSHRMAGSYNQERFADGYDLLAENLAAGNGYRFYPDTARTLMREPGYPLILAGLMLLFGESLTAVKVVNMILALLTAWLITLIARELAPKAWGHNSIVLLVPPLLFLFNPGTLVAESRGGVEITFGFLLAVFILSIYRATQSHRFLDYLLSGVVLGFTLLVRSTPILFPLFLLAFLLYCDGRRVSKIVICRNIATLIFASVAVLSPWIIRNFSLTGKFVPTASVMGVSAQAGQYINEHLLEGRPMWLLDREASRERDKVASNLRLPFEDGPGGYYQTFYKSIDEITFSKYLMGEVVSNYKRSPTLLLRCLGQNIFNFWIAGKTWIATALNTILQLPYLVLATIGSIYCFRNEKARSVSLVLLFISYYVAVHIAILAQARYSIPLLPLISILGTIGIVAVQKRITEKNNAPEPIAVDALAGR
jgi:4-amino-4-deoxy-L-arabinose transferase-like glycosyltransferase